jgi:Fe-S oxidoreductase
MLLDKVTHGPLGNVVTNCPICRTDLHATVPPLKFISAKGNAKEMVKYTLAEGKFSLTDLQTPNFIANEIKINTVRGLSPEGLKFRVELVEGLSKCRHKKYMGQCVRWVKDNDEYRDKVVKTAVKWCEKLGVDFVQAWCGCCMKPAHLPE